MTIHNSLSELIGNTPLVKLNHVRTDGIKATIAVKVEYFNPGGSSKDRIAERIIDAAERSGQLKPGGVIVEPTSGNTGVGSRSSPSSAATVRSSPCRTRSPNPSVRCCAHTAPKWSSPPPTPAGRPALLLSGRRAPRQHDSRRLPPEPVRQSERPESHYHTTGPEIWEATDHKVTHFVAGIGTGGTISGTGHYLKDVSNGAVRSSAPIRKAPSTPTRTTCTNTRSKASARTSTRRPSTGDFPTRSCRSPTRKPSK